jgi:hypothetical protein
MDATSLLCENEQDKFLKLINLTKMDVYKVLDDLKKRAAGVDPKTNKMPEGYFVSFRPIGLPIAPEDYQNPWSPFGSELLGATESAAAESAKINPPATSANAMPSSAPPQITMNQLIAAGVGQSEKNYYNTFWLTNDKLAMDEKWTVMPDAGTVDSAWFAIINGAQEVTSNMVLNSDLQKSIEAAKAVLVDPKTGNPTPHYNAYLYYQQKYYDAQQNLNGQYADAIEDPNEFAMWPIKGKIPQEKVNSALEAWAGLGYKSEIETALDTLNAQGMDPAIALINRAKLAYENSLGEMANIGTIPYTFIEPSTFYDAYEQDGWTKYYQDSSNVSETTSSSGFSESGFAGISVGFFSIGAEASHSQSQTDLHIDTSSMQISFEFCSADIRRPWLDTNLLDLTNWFLLNNSKNCISDGTFNQQLQHANNVTTFLPSIVTSLIFVRNLKIKWAMTQQQRHTFQEATSGGGMVGIGPFFCGGSGASNDANSSYQSTFNDEGIEVAGVQLVGYVSVITPASPRLDSKDYMVKAGNQPGSATSNTNTTTANSTTSATQPAMSGVPQ